MLCGTQSRGLWEQAGRRGLAGEQGRQLEGGERGRQRGGADLRLFACGSVGTSGETSPAPRRELRADVRELLAQLARHRRLVAGVQVRYF